MASRQGYPISDLPTNAERGFFQPTYYDKDKIVSFRQDTQNTIYAQPTNKASPRGTQPVSINVPEGGLECLTQMDYLRIKQGVKGIEVFSQHESNYKYGIADSQGNYFFGAREITEHTCRLCFTPELHMKIQDLDGNEVIHMYIPLVCHSCCFPCGFKSIEVYGPAGELIGTVEQKWGIFRPKLVVKDIKGNVVLGIQGPVCKNTCFSNSVKFDLMTPDGSTPIGEISKTGTSCFKDCGAGNYGDYEVRFSTELDVKIKVLMLGAVFLIDFTYFYQDNSCFKPSAFNLYARSMVLR